jgi:hypothetical protein
VFTITGEKEKKSSPLQGMPCPLLNPTVFPLRPLYFHGVG